MRGMLTTKSWVVAGILALCLAVSVQGQICKFQHNYEAECRYRIDELSLSQIEVEVNHCNDPIDVTFEIENESPEVHWSHTFTKQDEIVSVPGFRVDVQVQMLLSLDEEKKFWVRADFITDHQKRAFFLDEKLSITSEDCTSLNKAGKIAVGFLIVLLVICGVLVGVLLYIRRRRQRRNNPHRTLVEADSISCSDLRTSGSGPNVAAEPVVSFKCPGQAMTSPLSWLLTLGTVLPQSPPWTVTLRCLRLIRPRYHCSQATPVWSRLAVALWTWQASLWRPRSLWFLNGTRTRVN